jgi:adenylate cyclase
MIGFTSLSERLPPEEVVTMLNDYYRDMAGIIFHWDGTLDKFVGDEIMAIWNAPADQPNHAELAVRCALDMSDRLDKLREEWRGKGKDLLDCGIGINTGEVIIGNIGLPGKKMDYTAIGNHVNIAARVEKLTREYHSRILVTGATWEAANSGRFGHITATEYPPVAVKGKEETVTIYALTSLPSDEDL